MKILFVGDSIPRLNPAGDSSLAMVRAAMAAKLEVYWVTPENLWQRGSDIWAATEKLEPFLKDRLPGTAGGEKRTLSDFKAIFIRKDPPFDTAYVQLCWQLSLYEEKIFQLNRASLLLRHHEKMIPFEAVRQGFLSESDLIPTFIGSQTRAESWAKEHGYHDLVVKPYLGHGGEEIAQTTVANLNKITFKHAMMVQPLRPEVKELGDRRVLYLNGEILGDVVRVPKAGSIVSNLAQGGAAVHRPMDAAEMAAAKKVGAFLKKEGIFFAGSDMIGPKVSEVNITSPTGLRSLEKLHGDDKATPIIQAVLAQL